MACATADCAVRFGLIDVFLWSSPGQILRPVINLVAVEMGALVAWRAFTIKGGADEAMDGKALAFAVYPYADIEIPFIILVRLARLLVNGMAYLAVRPGLIRQPRNWTPFYDSHA